MVKNVLSSEMAALMLECDVPEDFKNWLCKFNICSFDSFVWGARNNSDKVDSDLIDAAAVKDLNITGRIAIRSAWHKASIEVAKRTEAKKAPAQLENNQPICKDDAKTLHDTFANRHNFRLGSVRLLSDQLQGRLLREYGSNPKTFQAILPEKLVFRDAITSPVGTQLNYINGEMPWKTDIFEDKIADMVDLWTRCRALCDTMSFISIQDPDWFPWGEAEAFADKLLVWMNQKYNGKRASLQYLIQAYVSTFSYFCNELRDHPLVSLSALVKNEAQYRSFWTTPYGAEASSSVAPPVFQQPATPRSGHQAHPDQSGAISSELNRMRSMTDKLHARLDNYDKDKGRDNRQQDRQVHSKGGNRGGDRGDNGGGKDRGNVKRGKGGGGGDKRGEKRNHDERRNGDLRDRYGQNFRR